MKCQIRSSSSSYLHPFCSAFWEQNEVYPEKILCFMTQNGIRSDFPHLRFLHQLIRDGLLGVHQGVGLQPAMPCWNHPCTIPAAQLVAFVGQLIYFNIFHRCFLSGKQIDMDMFGKKKRFQPPGTRKPSGFGGIHCTDLSPPHGIMDPRHLLCPRPSTTSSSAKRTWNSWNSFGLGRILCIWK